MADFPTKMFVDRQRRSARGMVVAVGILFCAMLLAGCGASERAALPPPTATSLPVVPTVIPPPTATVPPTPTNTVAPAGQVVVITPAAGGSAPLAPGGRIITTVPLPIGGPAPDFTLTTGDGSTLTKAALAGKPTLLFFFASWCPHCQAEVAPLTQIAAAHPDVAVVAIGVHDHETAQDIYAFQTRFALPFPTWDGGGKAAQAYGIDAFPTMIAVNRGGDIVGADIGEVPLASLEALVGKATR
jgi:peroxiredoxin